GMNMARFSRGYDRPYYDEGYGFGGGWGPFANQSRHRRSAGYDTDYAADRYRRRSGGYGRDRWAGGRYDQGIRYDEDYGSWQSRPRKTQWQTDYGDPFGDRQQRTPMRVIRGEPRWNERGR